MIQQAIGRNAIMLGCFAALTTGVIAATYLGTKDQIAEQIRRAQEKALLEIVPRERHDNQMLEATVSVSDKKWLELADSQNAYVATAAGEAVAIIIPVRAPDGYSGAIDMLVGVNIDGSIAGVRIVRHAETPGLGDKIELKKSDWVLSFDGKSLGNPGESGWAVKKDKGEFDQFTGATITPRAVTSAVHKALRFAQENSASLVSSALQMSEEADGQER